jgi:hypothetical protein
MAPDECGKEVLKITPERNNRNTRNKDVTSRTPLAKLQKTQNNIRDGLYSPKQIHNAQGRYTRPIADAIGLAGGETSSERDALDAEARMEKLTTHLDRLKNDIAASFKMVIENAMWHDTPREVTVIGCNVLRRSVVEHLSLPIGCFERKNCLKWNQISRHMIDEEVVS